MTQRHEPREPREGYARGLVEIGAEHEADYLRLDREAP